MWWCWALICWHRWRRVVILGHPFVICWGGRGGEGREERGGRGGEGREERGGRGEEGREERGARGGEQVKEGGGCGGVVPWSLFARAVLGPRPFVIRRVRFAFVGCSWLCGWSSLAAGVFASCHVVLWSSCVMGGASGCDGLSSSLVVVVGCCVGVFSAHRVCWLCCGSRLLLGCGCAVSLLLGCSCCAVLFLLGCGCHVSLSCVSAR